MPGWEAGEYLQLFILQFIRKSLIKSHQIWTYMVFTGQEGGRVWKLLSKKLVAIAVIQMYSIKWKYSTGTLNLLKYVTWLNTPLLLHPKTFNGYQVTHKQHNLLFFLPFYLSGAVLLRLKQYMFSSLSVLVMNHTLIWGYIWQQVCRQRRFQLTSCQPEPSGQTITPW